MSFYSNWKRGKKAELKIDKLLQFGNCFSIHQKAHHDWLLCPEYHKLKWRCWTVWIRLWKLWKKQQPANQLPINSNCWWNSYVYSCRTWVPVCRLNVSWGLLAATRGCSPSLLHDPSVFQAAVLPPIFLMLQTSGFKLATSLRKCSVFKGSRD